MKFTVSYHEVIDGEMECPICEANIHYCEFLNEGRIFCICEECGHKFTLNPIMFEVVKYD